MTTQEVITELNKLWDIYVKPTMIVISGGEPLMQAKKLEALCAPLKRIEHDIHIETAGTLMPTPELHRLVAQYNVSPKLAHSGNRPTKRYKPTTLRWFAAQDQTWFKFVVQKPEDFAEIDFIVMDCEIPTDRVMVMPEGVTVEDNINNARSFADEAIKRGYGISMRTHILLWKDIRGR